MIIPGLIMSNIWTMIFKYLLKFLGLDGVLALILKFCLGFLKKFITRNGLSDVEIMTIQGIDIINRTLGKELAKRNDHKLDDQIVANIENQIKMFSKEFGFELHQVGNIK
jgi:hypothetical protein